MSFSNGENSTYEKCSLQEDDDDDDVYSWFSFQIFTNADTNHAISALKILGLEDCFESIISFDTLNPSNDKDGSESRPTTAEVLDICERLCRNDSDMELPSTPLVCKPFDQAFEYAFKIADIDPQRTVRTFTLLSLGVSSFLQFQSN